MSTTEIPASPAAAAPVTSPAINPVDSIGSGPNQVVFDTPPIETPQLAAVPDATPYHVSELQNGQYEVKLDSGHIYKGTQVEVMNKLAEAQYNATRHIAELKGKGPFAQPQQPQEVVAPVVEGQMDPTAAALADLVAQGLGLRDRNDLIEQVSMLPHLQQNYEQQQLNQVAAQFLTHNQDFPMSDRNIEMLDQAVTQTGMGLTPQNIEIVHHYLKSTGQYEKVMTQARPQNGNPMPMAPNGQGMDGGTSEQDMWAMPMNQLEKFMRGQK